MSLFITNASEYHGAENMDIVLRPAFTGKKVTDFGFRVVDTKGASSIKLTFFDKLNHIVMPYATGFGGLGIDTKRQKKFSLGEFKAEMAMSKQDYLNTILEILARNNNFGDNEITPGAIEKACLQLLMTGVQTDVLANFWLGNTAKTHTKAGTYPTGVAYAAGDADKYYNVINGVLTAIMASAYQRYVSKQTEITGWNQVTYPILYLAESSGTVYAYGSASHRSGAQSGNRLFSFTASNSSYPYHAAISVLNTSGFGGYVTLEQLIGTSATFELYAAYQNYIPRAALPAALTTDTAETYMKKVYRIASPELKGIPKNELRYYVTNSILENYEDTLQSGTTEAARKTLIDGVERYSFNGIPIIPMDVDAQIMADFASTFPHNWIVLTTPANLALVLNGSGMMSTAGPAETRLWFNPDQNENRARTQFEFGADFIVPELVSVGYYD